MNKRRTIITTTSLKFEDKFSFHSQNKVVNNFGNFELIKNYGNFELIKNYGTVLNILQEDDLDL